MTTGKTIKFLGTGEKVDCLEVFHPSRLAGRILDMGDILTLVEKAQSTFDEKQTQELQQKLKKDAFTLEDFKNQLQQIKKLGSMESILSMIPGFSAMKQARDVKIDEKELSRIEAIINSMTMRERTDPSILNASRRQRIARGSGTKVSDVNKLINQYQDRQDDEEEESRPRPQGLFQNRIARRRARQVFDG